MKERLVKVVLAAFLICSLAGCSASTKQLAGSQAQLAELEAKTNQALQQSAAAKIDGTTALQISTANQDRLDELEVKTNESMQQSAAAKIDAATALYLNTAK